MVVVVDFNADYPIAPVDRRRKREEKSERERGTRPPARVTRTSVKRAATRRERTERGREREWKGKERRGQKKRERQNPRPEDEEWQRLILRALHREFPTGREVLPLVECRVTINIDDAPFFLRFFSWLFHGHSAIPRQRQSRNLSWLFGLEEGGGWRREGQAEKREMDKQSGEVAKKARARRENEGK